jgi:WD40-like Beta Propeller Repeat
MTPIDTFERHLPSALTDLAAPNTPDYLTDILGRTAATRQRPAWASIERWLPVQLATSRVPTTRVPWRQLAVLAVLAVLLATMLAVYVGTRTPHVPPPFGPAENGRLVYSADGDIVIRDALQSTPRVLIGGPTDDHDPGYSPDGTRLLYLSNEGGNAYLMSSAADGTGGIRILDDPIADGAHVTWAPDSKRVAVVNAPRGIPQLSIVAVDGYRSRSIELTGLRPTDILWRPPDGHRLLVRAIKPTTLRADQSPYTPIQFYIVDVDGRPRGRCGQSGSIRTTISGLSGTTAAPSGHSTGARSTTTSSTRRRATRAVGFGSTASAPTALTMASCRHPRQR